MNQNYWVDCIAAPKELPPIAPYEVVVAVERRKGKSGPICYSAPHRNTR